MNLNQVRMNNVKLLHLIDKVIHDFRKQNVCFGNIFLTTKRTAKSKINIAKVKKSQPTPPVSIIFLNINFRSLLKTVSAKRCVR